MKRRFLLLLLSFFVILLILYVKNDNSKIKLNSDKDFQKVEQFFRKKFKEYDNKFTSVTFFITPYNQILEKIVVNYQENEINYRLIYDNINGFSEGEPSKALVSTFGMDKVQLSLFPEYLKIAQKIILEKYSNYHNFRINNISYHITQEGFFTQFRVLANQKNTSSSSEEDLEYSEFNLFVEKDNTILLMGD